MPRSHISEFHRTNMNQWWRYTLIALCAIIGGVLLVILIMTIVALVHAVKHQQLGRLSEGERRRLLRVPHHFPIVSLSQQYILLHVLKECTAALPRQLWWLASGALLGWCRHDKQLIPWDDDIDINILETDIDHIEQSIRAHNANISSNNDRVCFWKDTAGLYRMTLKRYLIQYWDRYDATAPEIHFGPQGDSEIPPQMPVIDVFLVSQISIPDDHSSTRHPSVQLTIDNVQAGVDEKNNEPLSMRSAQTTGLMYRYAGTAEHRSWPWTLHHDDLFPLQTTESLELRDPLNGSTVILECPITIPRNPIAAIKAEYGSNVLTELVATPFHHTNRIFQKWTPWLLPVFALGTQRAKLPSA